VAGIFGGIAAAGRLMGLDADAIESAFGIAGSLASGSMQFLEDGAWNKRLHHGVLFAERSDGARVRAGRRKGRDQSHRWPLRPA